MSTLRRNRTLVDILEEQERDIKRLKQALARVGNPGVTDHGALTGLGDNDHTQYSLTTHNHDGDYAANPHTHSVYVPLAGGLMTGYLQIEDQQRVEWLNASLGSASFGIDPTEQGVFRLRLGGGVTAIDEFRIEASGDSEVLRATTSWLITPGVVRAGDGSQSAPGLSFRGDTDSGLFNGSTYVGLSNDNYTSLYAKTPSSSTSTVLREGGAVVIGGGQLGTSSGDIARALSIRLNTGSSNTLEFQAVRYSAGSSWSTARHGIRLITDSTDHGSLWFYNNMIAVKTTDFVAGYEFQVSGQVACMPNTTGSTSAGYWQSVGLSRYEWRRNTSTRRHKFDIDYDEKWEALYADATLPALTRHGRLDAEHEDDRYFGVVAEDLLEKNDPIVGEQLINRDEEGQVESPDILQIVYVLLAKVKRLERLQGLNSASMGTDSLEDA